MRDGNDEVNRVMTRSKTKINRDGVITEEAILETRKNMHWKMDTNSGDRNSRKDLTEEVEEAADRDEEIYMKSKVEIEEILKCIGEDARKWVTEKIKSSASITNFIINNRKKRKVEALKSTDTRKKSAAERDSPDKDNTNEVIMLPETCAN